MWNFHYNQQLKLKLILSPFITSLQQYITWISKKQNQPQISNNVQKLLIQKKQMKEDPLIWINLQTKILKT